MNVLDLFSGIGGFSLGLERAGMRTVAFCEIDPFCRRVLAKHWPGIPIFEDVRKLCGEQDGSVVYCSNKPWSIPGPIDVICGGFPCQDISSAGRGAGIDGARSGLWSEYARLIGELRPQFVVVENVAALLGRGLGRVLGDLAALGYDAEWHCIPASSVGARHRRDRIWIVANPGHGSFAKRAWSARWKIGEWKAEWAQSGCDGKTWALADTERGRLQGGDVERPKPPAIVPAALGGHCGGSEFGAPWRTEPDVGRVADGVPDAMDRLKGLGNAVVPQIPEIIGRAIMSRIQPVTSQDKQP